MYKNFMSLKNKLLFKRNYQSDCVYGYVATKKSANLKTCVSETVWQNRSEWSNFYRLVSAYRQHGHKLANVNPVSLEKNTRSVPEIQPSRYGLSATDTVTYKDIISSGNKTEGTVQEAVDALRNVYCKYIGAEFMHLESQEEIEWLCERLEAVPYEPIDDDTKRQLARHLINSQTFDHFLAAKFPTLKRYGGEGAESMMVFFYEFFRLSVEDKLQHVVMCMPHRGRLNLLTGMLRFPPVKMFHKLKGLPEFPQHLFATGDVVSHCVSSTDMDNELHVSLLYNPSHLEAINPVSMGKARAKHMHSNEGDYGACEQRWGDRIINLQVHGDAAYMGQGVNQECLALCRVPHFEIGGTVHLIVNNQVGFTTPAQRGRSSEYTSDVAKIIGAPVLHVNGDQPEAVLLAARLAFRYQRLFRKDVFVDVNCFRQWGHNELDDPTFTNPNLYKIIKSRKTVPDLYADTLINERVLTEQTVAAMKQTHRNWLDKNLLEVDDYSPPSPCFEKQWSGFKQAQPNQVTTWDTGVDIDLLTYIGTKSVSCPHSFQLHSHLLKTHVKNRLTKVSEGTNIDWSTAETLAIGSLLYDGYNVRLSGQDVGRGTFSHRHVMLVDQNTDNTYIPLNEMHADQNGKLEVANSILSEEAVLGFEYGMSIDGPNNLIVWEAQFGDFSNGAQIIIDTFIASGELKWLWSSSLVMLLPHGYDGAGPEHSSSRIERFLQLTDSKENGTDGDNVNVQVAQPSTPAQYFHLLRRQMVRDFRKPLVVITPKTLLRLSAATSTFQEMNAGTRFLPIIDDHTAADAKKIRKVIFTSGRHYYTLMDRKNDINATDTAIVRLECFCPFPAAELQKTIVRYSNVTVVVWSQEEPQNMGAWTFVRPRLESILGRKVLYSGRPVLGVPAVGVGKIHQEQVAHVVSAPFAL